MVDSNEPQRPELAAVCEDDAALIAAGSVELVAAVVRGLGCCQRLKAPVDSVLLMVYSLPIVIGRGIEGRAMATERRSTGCRLDAVLSLMFVELVLIFLCLLAAAACDVVMVMASEMLVGLLGSIDATLGCCRGWRNSARSTTSY